jgi:hypothetical protein
MNPSERVPHFVVKAGVIKQIHDFTFSNRMFAESVSTIVTPAEA